MRLLPILLACLTITVPLRAGAEVPRVAVDIAPLHSLVAQVMKGVGTPELILPAGASAHDHALRPSEAGALRDADLVVFTSHALTPWIEGPLATLAGDARLREVMAHEGSVRLAPRDEALFGGGDNDDHSHDEADLDAHGWLDPMNAAAWLETIATDLAEIDPDNAETYRANARDARDAVEAMSEEIAARLAPVTGQSFIVYHDAFQYFEARFGLSAAGALSPSDAAAPGPARVAAIRDLAAREGIACVFAEPGASPGLVENILPSQARLVTLDAMGATLEPGPALYGEMMRQLAEDIAGCLDG